MDGSSPQIKHSKGPNIIRWHFSSLIRTFRFGSKCSSKHLKTYSERCFMKMLSKSFIWRTRLIHLFPRAPKSNSGLSLMSTSFIIYQAIWKGKITQPNPGKRAFRQGNHVQYQKKYNGGRWTLTNFGPRVSPAGSSAPVCAGGALGLRIETNAGMHHVQIIKIPSKTNRQR